MTLGTLTIRKDDLLYEVIDPGQYTAKVASLPDIRANRYITVQFQILDEEQPDVPTNLDVQFDIKKPRKLLHFLRASGLSCSEDADFNIIPAAWKGKSCSIRVVTNQYMTAEGEEKERNAIAEFINPADVQ